MAGKLRLDALLVRRGLVGGRDRAKELIAQGLVTVSGLPAQKPSQLCGEEEPIALLGEQARLVSRAAQKLEGALEAFPIELEGRVVLDIGASTGGFTQVALERGARQVYAVDVGTGQLAEALRQDPRVIDLQQTDIRALSPESLPQRPEAAVCDVSFISLRLVLPALRRLLIPEGEAVVLIKPQFEAGRQAVGRGGIVRDPQVHRRVLREMTALFPQEGFALRGLIPSPIRGGDGNAEYLAWLGPRGASVAPPVDELVMRALAGQSER